MAVTVIVTPGATNANSYISVADATSYFGERLNVSAWTNADADDKARALITATHRLDQERFQGTRAIEDQSLEWPRYGAVDRDGWLLDSDTIPTAIQRATCELALVLLSEDLLADSGLEAFAEVSIGPISVKPNIARIAGTLPRNVARIIAYLSNTAGGASITVYRA